MAGTRWAFALPGNGVQNEIGLSGDADHAGINDPRVPPWESLKFAARLQAATSSDKPVLLRIDYAAGHGMGSTKSQRQEETADVWSFLLWQFGQGGFQPAR